MKTMQKTLLAVLAITMSGLGQLAWAGPVGTDFVVDADVRESSQLRVETLLAREAVASEFARHGVEPAVIAERLSSMTNTELLELEGHIDELVAGEGVLGLVGAVFVVLLILEVVGVTDIFKSV